MTCSRRSTRWCGSVVAALACATTVFAQSPEPARSLESEVRQAIVETVKNRMGADADVRIDAIRLGARAGSGQGTLAAVPEPGARLGRPLRFTLSRRAPRAARGVSAGYAVATVFVAAPHARATRAISRGETCAAADVATVRSEVGAVLLQHLPEAGEIVGRQAVRDVVADEVITRSLVGVRAVVQSGDVVVLEAGVEGVRAQTEGVATQSGGPGDTIRVVNRDSRRTVKARVVGSGKVEVVQ